VREWYGIPAGGASSSPGARLAALLLIAPRRQRRRRSTPAHAASAFAWCESDDTGTLALARGGLIELSATRSELLAGGQVEL
jgi:hypothetical protein